MSWLTDPPVADVGWLIAEWRRLSGRLAESEAENDQWQKKLADTWVEVERLRAALSEMLESFTEPEDDNDILRRARAALGKG